MDDYDKQSLRSQAISKGVGSFRTVCPGCSKDRRKKGLKVLSVTNDGEKILWQCWHCQDAGAMGVEEPEPRRKPDWRERQRSILPTPPIGRNKAVKKIGLTLDPLSVAYLKGRGISQETAELYRATYAFAYFPDLQRETPAIAFPYAIATKDHPYKVRSTEDKAHVCERACSSLFGLELVDIQESGDFIICEGELDALAMREAGILNATSVPNGASSFARAEGDDDKAVMSFLWTAKEKIESAKRVIIATDMDEPGTKLAEELARRIGRHRCWRAKFSEGCKDANDELLNCGSASLVKCVEHSEPWPVEGLYEARHFLNDLLQLYDVGVGDRILTGLTPVDELYSSGSGLLTVLTGLPGSGKSTFIDQLMLNQARTYGHTFAVCSFENPCHVHMAKLAEMLLQKHYLQNDNMAGDRMTREELRSVVPFINDHFKYIMQEDGSKATLASIIERIKTAVFRWGVRGVVIDPYNYIQRPKKDDAETVWVDEMLTQLRMLAQCHDLHIWLVAHPTKLHMDADGSYPAPRGYSISGSAAFYSKADFGLTIHRAKDKPGIVDILCWKCRFDWLGKEGRVSILYDTATNVFLSDVLDQVSHPMTYRDAKDGDDDEAYLYRQ